MRSRHDPCWDLRRARCGDDSHGGFGRRSGETGWPKRPAPRPGPTSHLCGVTGTLIADGDGIYDPAAYSDRLVLVAQLIGHPGVIGECANTLIS